MTSRLGSGRKKLYYVSTVAKPAEERKKRYRPESERDTEREKEPNGIIGRACMILPLFIKHHFIQVQVPTLLQFHRHSSSE